MVLQLQVVSKEDDAKLGAIKGKEVLLVFKTWFPSAIT